MSSQLLVNEVNIIINKCRLIGSKKPQMLKTINRYENKGNGKNNRKLSSVSFVYHPTLLTVRGSCVIPNDQMILHNAS